MNFPAAFKMAWIDFERHAIEVDDDFLWSGSDCRLMRFYVSSFYEGACIVDLVEHDFHFLEKSWQLFVRSKSRVVFLYRG